MKLERLVRYLDETLLIKRYPADSSLNGLQVEGAREVGKAVMAVDVSEQSIRAALRRNAGILIVHHGLFWGPQQPVTGILARRIGLLLGGGVSLYACHLPLDCHPEIGNNATIAGLFRLKGLSPFGEYHGYLIGLKGTLPRPAAADRFAAQAAVLLRSRPQPFLFGPGRIRTLGVVSGGAAELVKDAAEAGCDAFLTGETSHSAYHTARECGINLFCAGHYATETFGVKALGEKLAGELALDVSFADIPTGL